MQLTMRNIDSLDCVQLVQRFPEVAWLYLHGRLGLFSGAGELNRLHSLQRIRIVDLFGMTREDCLSPQRVPELESVDLYSISAEHVGIPSASTAHIDHASMPLASRTRCLVGTAEKG